MNQHDRINKNLHDACRNIEIATWLIRLSCFLTSVAIIRSLL